MQTGTGPDPSDGVGGCSGVYRFTRSWFRTRGHREGYRGVQNPLVARSRSAVGVALAELPIKREALWHGSGRRCGARTQVTHRRSVARAARFGHGDGLVNARACRRIQDGRDSAYECVPQRSAQLDLPTRTGFPPNQRPPPTSLASTPLPLGSHPLRRTPRPQKAVTVDSGRSRRDPTELRVRRQTVSDECVSGNGKSVSVLSNCCSNVFIYISDR